MCFRHIAVLIFLLTLTRNNLFVKIYDLMHFIRELTKTQCFFYVIKGIVELKPYFFFTVTEKMPIQFPFFQKRFYISSVQKNQLISNSGKLSRTTFTSLYSF